MSLQALRTGDLVFDDCRALVLSYLPEETHGFMAASTEVN